MQSVRVKLGYLKRKSQAAKVIRKKKRFKIDDTLLERNKQTAYDSPLTMTSVMNIFFIDKIDNIRAEFQLLEGNSPSYSFRSMDSTMPMCPTGLYHVDPVTDTEL